MVTSLARTAVLPLSFAGKAVRTSTPCHTAQSQCPLSIQLPKSISPTSNVVWRKKSIILFRRTSQVVCANTSWIPSRTHSTTAVTHLYVGSWWNFYREEEGGRQFDAPQRYVRLFWIIEPRPTHSAELFLQRSRQGFHFFSEKRRWIGEWFCRKSNAAEAVNQYVNLVLSSGTLIFNSDCGER